MVTRRKTTEVLVGGVAVGGTNPVVVQSMTNTDTADVDATVGQILALGKAGSELVRVTVNNEGAAKAVPEIVARLRDQGVTTPVIGDFNDWDGRRNPMRLRGQTGVWEIFMPGLGDGEA